MKKIEVIQDGKNFEAFVQLVISEHNDQSAVTTLLGIAIAGNSTACRAIHAALYSNPTIIISDDTSSSRKRYVTKGPYRRIETFHGKVCHMLIVHDSAVKEEYQQGLVEAEHKGYPLPSRLILAPKGDLEKRAGLHLANLYGLPKTPDWSEQYVSLLPDNKWREVDVETTELSGPWKSLRAGWVYSMKENEILQYIEEAIQRKQLNVNTELGRSATFYEGMTTEQYLRENAELLAEKLDQHLKPLYDGKHLIKYIGETKRVSIPEQAKAAMGLITLLEKGEKPFLVGEMSVGKTQISLTTVHTLARMRQMSGAKDGYRCLIVAPSITVPKWAQSEIPQILGTNKIRVTVIQNTEDALKYVKKVKAGYKVPQGEIEFVLVATDRMKLTANKFLFSGRWNPHNETWHCPDCGKVITVMKENNKMPIDWGDVVEKPASPPSEKKLAEAKKHGTLTSNGIPRGYIKRFTNKIRRFMCDCHNRPKISRTTGDRPRYEGETLQQLLGHKHCALTRPALKQKGEDRVKNRWMIAQIFQQQLKNHFHIGIFDEIHEMAASDSGRGAAFHKILKSCKKSMFLTGTLTNGTASSIQATLWRTDPESLLAEGFSHRTSKEAWAKKYGVIEEVRYINESGIAGRTTNRKQDRVILREKPGIAPQLVANHLLHKCVFLDFKDLGLPMVELVEEPVIIEPEEEHNECYQQFHKTHFDAANQWQKEIGPRAWSQFYPSTINYADQPQKGAHVEFRADDGSLLDEITAPKFNKFYFTSKEKKLINMVKERIQQNRGCIVFTKYTGEKYDINQRLRFLFENEGIPCEILSANTSPQQRFEWLEERAKKGSKLLIMNVSLCSVGLDLLHWPSLFFYQCEDNIRTLRQTAKRAHRIMQFQKCEVFYLVMDKTIQMDQFKRLMTRRISSLLVEGRITKDDPLAQFADDSHGQLARDLTESLENSEIVSRWKQAAAKEINDLEIHSEEDIQKETQKAFQQLTKETLERCGLPLDRIPYDDQAIEKPIILQPEKPKTESVSTANLLDLIKQAEQEERMENNDLDVCPLNEQYTYVKVKTKKKPGKPSQEYIQYALNI